MLPPHIVRKLADEYRLAIGARVVVPDGRQGRLINVRFDPDIAVVQFLGSDYVYRSERFNLGEVLPTP